MTRGRCDAPAALCAALLIVAPAHAQTTARPRFHGHVSALDAATRARMTTPGTGSWHVGCPVSLDDLRLIEVDHRGFDGATHVGHLVVHRTHAHPLLRVFRALFESRFPIERIEPVDTYDSDDHRSMDANNTSAFNCREVAGRRGVWSQHAYGMAIDLNPAQNPYVAPGVVSPRAGLACTDRARRQRGMVLDGDLVVRAFASIGWRWGGHWIHSRDYQHFSANGR